MRTVWGNKDSKVMKKNKTSVSVSACFQGKPQSAVRWNLIGRRSTSSQEDESPPARWETARQQLELAVDMKTTWRRPEEQKCVVGAHSCQITSCLRPPSAPLLPGGRLCVPDHERKSKPPRGLRRSGPESPSGLVPLAPLQEALAETWPPAGSWAPIGQIQVEDICSPGNRQDGRPRGQRPPRRAPSPAAAQPPEVQHRLTWPEPRGGPGRARLPAQDLPLPEVHVWARDGRRAGEDGGQEGGVRAESSLRQQLPHLGVSEDQQSPEGPTWTWRVW